MSKKRIPKTPRKALKSRNNMWSWDFERFSKILIRLDEIRIRVNDLSNSDWYSYLEEYKSFLKTLVINWVCFITDKEVDKINDLFEEYSVFYDFGIKNLKKPRVSRRYFIQGLKKLDMIDLKLMRIKQFKGLGLDIEYEISDKTKLRRYLLNE